MRAVAVLVGLGLLVAAATTVFVGVDPEAPHHGAFVIGYWAIVIAASSGVSLYLHKAWAVAVIALLVVTIFVTLMGLSASRGGDHMWPIAAVGFVLFVTPALMLWLAVVNAGAAAVRRVRTR